MNVDQQRVGTRARTPRGASLRAASRLAHRRAADSPVHKIRLECADRDPVMESKRHFDHLFYLRPTQRSAARTAQTNAAHGSRTPVGRKAAKRAVKLGPRPLRHEDNSGRAGAILIGR